MDKKPAYMGSVEWYRIHMLAYFAQNRDSESFKKFNFDLHQFCNNFKFDNESFIEKALSKEKNLKLEKKKLKKEQKLFQK